MIAPEYGLIGTRTRYFEEEFGKEITKEEYDNIINEFEKNYDEGVSSVPSCYTKLDYILKITQGDIIGIVSLLNWDIKLNQKAIETGKHPVTGCKSGEHNQHIILRNKRWMKLLGVYPDAAFGTTKIPTKQKKQSTDGKKQKPKDYDPWNDAMLEGPYTKPER